MAGNGLATFGPRSPQGVSAAEVLALTSGGGPVTITRLPAVVNIVIYAGDDLALTLQVHDPDGTDADLTGADVIAEIADQPGGAHLDDWAVTIEDSAIRLHLPWAVSGSLPRNAVYDCRMISAGDWRTTLIAGTITTAESVSRWPGTG